MSAHRLRLAVTEDAAIDLEDIQAYTLTQWGKEQAREYEDALDRAFATLREQPQLGISRDDLLDGLRGYTVQSHIVFYLIVDDTLVVQRVLHQRMDSARAFSP
mgnify:CR=1 FL=1